MNSTIGKARGNGGGIAAWIASRPIQGTHALITSLFDSE
jgi:hypothetical protein